MENEHLYFVKFLKLEYGHVAPKSGGQPRRGYWEERTAVVDAEGLQSMKGCPTSHRIQRALRFTAQEVIDEN